jgi:hypothetical protein
MCRKRIYLRFVPVAFLFLVFFRLSAYRAQAASGLAPEQVRLVGTFHQATGDLGHYGRSSAVQGQIAVVGSSSSTYEDEPLSAYVYDFSDPHNIIERRLFYPGTNSNLLSQFGESVAVSGNFVFVGAPNENNIGAVYMYDVSDMNHITYRRIVAYDIAPHTAFGESLAADGNRLLVGNPKYSAGSTQPPAAYLFDFSDPAAIQQRKIVRDPNDRVGRFGETLDIDGDFAIIGDWSDNSAGGFTGSAYIYDLRDLSNATSTHLVAYDAAFTRDFGRQVALSGTTALVQASGDLGPVVLPGNRTGVVYSHDFSNWPSVTQTEFGIPKDLFQSPAFGRAVELDGNLAVIVASGLGQTFLYDMSDTGDPDQLAVLSTPGAWSASIDGNRILVAGNGVARLYQIVPEPAIAVSTLAMLLAACGVRWKRF